MLTFTFAVQTRLSVHHALEFRVLGLCLGDDFSKLGMLVCRVGMPVCRVGVILSLYSVLPAVSTHATCR